MMSAVILWLFVIDLGIACGAGLYETRISVPRWLTGSPETGYRWNRAAALEDNDGLRVWAYDSTMPLTLLTLASLVTARWMTRPVHRRLLDAAPAASLVRAMKCRHLIA